MRGPRVAWVLLPAIPLAAFFAFVGYMKAFAPLAELRRHHAWTTALPDWTGRLVGWSEIACAAALILGSVLPGRRRWAMGAALVLLANQGVATAVHLSRGEAGALPQNAVLAVLLVATALLARR